MGAAVLVGAILLLCILIWVASNVVTGEDARASYMIHEEFTDASTNIVTGKKLVITSSPRHTETCLYVYGDLSVKEVQALQVLAVQISKNNNNRPVIVRFRSEIPERLENN
jgi:hypothetical protein